MKMLCPLTVLAMGLLLAAGTGHAGDGSGTVSAVFLTLPPDAVTAALGGTSAAARPLPAAVFGNPAGLAGVKTAAAEFSHSLWLGDISYNTLGAAAPCLGGTAAIGLRYLRYGGIDALDNTGAAADSISPRDMAFSAAWAAELGGGWSAGAGGKYVDSRIAASASAFALDAGLRFSRGRITAGASVENLGGTLKFNKEAFRLPTLFKAGTAFQAGSMLQLFFDVSMPRSGAGWLSAGAQYPLTFKKTALNLRGGYTSRYSETGGFNGWSSGVGLIFKDFLFDYAFMAGGDLGAAHQFGLGMRWGAAEGAKDNAGAGMVMMIP